MSEFSEVKQTRRTAILVDGGFYRTVAYKLWGRKSPVERAKELEEYCSAHLRHKHEIRDLYRIFYYDFEQVRV